MNTERPLNPRLTRAMEDLRNAVGELRAAQDPLLKKVLRQAAKDRLYNTATIKDASVLVVETKPKPISNN